MSDSMAALTLLVAIATGAPVNEAARPRIRIAEVAGEVRVVAPRTGELPAQVSEIALGSEVSVPSGRARVETDLPAAVSLRAGDRVLFAPAPDRPDGLMIQVLDGKLVLVETGENRLMLDLGDTAAFWPQPGGTMRVRVTRAHIETTGQGRAETIEAGETLYVASGPRGFKTPPVDVRHITTSRTRTTNLELVSMRSPQVTLAEVAREQPVFRAMETDLRSAVGPKPMLAPRPLRSPPLPAPAHAQPGPVHLDLVAAAIVVAGLLLGGFLWLKGLD